MKCKNCYELCNPIADCLETLGIMTTEDSQALKAIIIDKFDCVYKADVTSSANGLVTIDLTNDDVFPEELLNPYAGEFTLAIEKNGVIVPFTVDGIAYDCLRFSVVHVTPMQTNYLIDVYNTSNSNEYN